MTQLSAPASTVSWPDPVDRRRAAIVVAAVVAVVALATFAFGGVPAWLQPLLIVAGTFLGVSAVLWRRSGIMLRLEAIALAAFVSLVVAQMAPLPLAVISGISPARGETLRELGESPSWTALSYYTQATREGLAHLLLGVAVYAAVAVGVRSKESVQWLLAGLFGVGVAESLLAILQIAVKSPGIYGDPVLGTGPWTGSFVNHSNFCQLVNVSFGAGIGLLLIRSSDQRREASRLRRKITLGSYLQGNGLVLFCLAIQVVAIALSLSRGGALGLVAGLAVLGLAVGTGQGSGARRWGVVGAAFAVLGVLLLFGGETLYGRFSKSEVGTDYGDRFELSAATLGVGWRHLATGTGLSTHRFVFPAFDTTQMNALAEQADNDYAQLFEETGLPGVVLVTVFLASLIATGVRTVSSSKASSRYALYGVLYALTACAVQSLSDFGQRLPAVFCAMAAMCGLATAMVSIDRTHLPGPGSGRAPRRGVSLAIAVGVLVVGGLFVRVAWNDYLAERWESIAFGLEEKLRKTDWEADPADYLDLLAAAEKATEARPTDVQLAYWLNVYRWQTFTGGADPAELVATPEGRAVAEQIIEELVKTRELCPTFGPIHSLEGQVRLALNDPAGFDRIESGFKLSPTDPEACYNDACAACLRDPPDRDLATKRLLRCVALDGGYYRSAAGLWIDFFSDFDTPAQLAVGNPERLRLLAELVEERGRDEMGRDLRAKVLELTAARVAEGEATADQIAALAGRLAKGEDPERAVLLYRQALAQRHGNVRWRLALSDLLAELERYEEAFREARLCFRLKPGWEPARKRMDQLILLVERGGGVDLPPLEAAAGRSAGGDKVGSAGADAD